MTIPAGEQSSARYSTSGSTVFDYPFVILLESELLVTVTDDDGVDYNLTLNTDYTVSGVGDPDGGSIAVSADLTDYPFITLIDNVQVSQETPFGNQGNFSASLHERAFDKLTRLVSRLYNRLSGNILSFPETVTDFDTTLPSSISGQSNITIMTNSGGDRFIPGPTADEISQAQAYAEEAKGYLEEFGGVQYADLFEDFVVSGLLPATSVDLTSNISAGGAYVSGVRVTKASVTPHTYSASVDTYVDLASDGTFSFSEVPTDDPSPSVSAGNIRLAKVVADADNITSVEDLRALLGVVKPSVGVSSSTGTQTLSDALDERVVLGQPYSNEPIGKPFPVWDHLTGADIPSNDGDAKFVKLTAGLTGAGQYNEGLIGSESVSGSYPNVQATAVITLPGSTLQGTLRLMNTEGRKLVAGATSGVVRQDQSQGWQLGAEEDATGDRDYWGVMGTRDSRANGSADSGYGLAQFRTVEQGDTKMLKAMDDGSNGVPRQGLENNDKDISATYYVRIK